MESYERFADDDPGEPSLAAVRTGPQRACVAEKVWSATSASFVLQGEDSLPRIKSGAGSSLLQVVPERAVP